MLESLGIEEGWNSCRFPLHRLCEYKETRRLALSAGCPALTVSEREGGGVDESGVSRANALLQQRSVGVWNDKAKP